MKLHIHVLISVMFNLICVIKEGPGKDTMMDQNWDGTESKLVASTRFQLICVYHDITITAMTAVERKSDFKLTRHTPYLALMGELCGVSWEDLGENWPRYDGIARTNFIPPPMGPVVIA